MIIVGEEAHLLRNAFVETFVDVETDYYKNYIQNMQLFSDGLCYTGYLWDCMIPLKRISVVFAMDYMSRKTSDIYVMWDIHSRDRVFIADYWKYPKDAVLRITSDQLEEMIDNLPEDCYFFDDTLYTIVLLY